MSNENFEKDFNRIVAPSILSDIAKKELEHVSDDVRAAIEALIVEGKIVEKDGKYYAKEPTNE
jgi:hypothetical protein